MNISKKELTLLIKEKALSEGFFKAGISRSEKLINESKHLLHWLDENKDAEMEWIGKSYEKRIDPSLIMEDVKSVLSLAYIYDTPVPHSENENIPRFSRYSWGKRDYHKVLKKKLKKLCREIENIPAEIKTRYYVDDGPVMDKAWAVRSGIGAVGKHSNIIMPEAGSYFFIASIFLNVELLYDDPIEDLCKTCRLCLDACPTGAIYDEYKVDSNLCISYQTIENKGEIPAEINLHGWVFGCDICQDVCPYNENKIFTEDEDFYPRDELFKNTFDDWLNYSEEDFNKYFEGTPVRRTKYKGFIRNIKKAKAEILK